MVNLNIFVQNVEEEIEEVDSPVPEAQPPNCINKCETCFPCESVLLTVPQAATSLAAVPVPSEDMPLIPNSYPEEWRCKCREKLYPIGNQFQHQLYTP